MSRAGFNERIHPYQLQLRICEGFDFQGIQNKGSVTLDFQEGKITNYHTDEDMVSTTIREYAASDDDLKELYSFLHWTLSKSLSPCRKVKKDSM